MNLEDFYYDHIKGNLGPIIGFTAVVLFGVFFFRGCATQEASTLSYERVRSTYQEYPQLRPMITKALEDDYLTKWEYADIRDEKWRLWKRTRKDAALRNLEFVKDKTVKTVKKPNKVISEPTQKAEHPLPPTDGPQVLEVQ